MVPARLCLWLLAVLGCLPLASAVPVIGTPDAPELYDASGDVTYSNAYPGPRDRDFLDINASWMDVDDIAQTFTLHIRVTSTDHMEEALATSYISCTMEAVLGAEGEPTGRILWNFADDNTPNRQGPSKLVQMQDTAGENRVLESKFEIELGTPGFYTWTVRRADVIGLPATNVQNLEGLCNERYGGLAAAAFPLVVNIDRATSESDYSLFDGPKADGSDPSDDFDTLNSGLPPVRSSTNDEPADQTPGVLFVMGVAAFGTAATLLRGRRN